MSRDFLIDTNVLSELMRTQPDFQVMNWFELHGDASCFTSSITKAEIFLGIALLPESKRRNRLTEAAEKMFSTDFSERCLSFDNQSAIN
jgi:toxin FitB